MNLFSKDYYKLNLDDTDENYINENEDTDNRLASVNQELITYIKMKGLNPELFIKEITHLQNILDSKCVSWASRYLNFLKNSKVETKTDICKVFKDLLLLLWIKDCI